MTNEKRMMYENKIFFAPVSGEIHLVRGSERKDGVFVRNGDAKDVTDEAIAAVWGWYRRQLENDGAIQYSVTYPGFEGLELVMRKTGIDDGRDE